MSRRRSAGIAGRPSEVIRALSGVSGIRAGGRGRVSANQSGDASTVWNTVSGVTAQFRTVGIRLGLRRRPGR